MGYGGPGLSQNGIGNLKPMGMAAPEGVPRAGPPPMQPMDNRMGSSMRRQSPYLQALRRKVGAGAPPQYMAGGNQFGLSGFSVPTMEQLGLTPPAPAQAAPQQPQMDQGRMQAMQRMMAGSGMRGIGMGGYNPYQQRSAPPQDGPSMDPMRMGGRIQQAALQASMRQGADTAGAPAINYNPYARR